MELLGFQEDAVTQLGIQIRQRLSHPDGTPRTVLLKAPTGSGKTVMAGRVIEGLAQDSAYDVAFIWIAPYSLQEQAGRSLATILAPAQKLSDRQELANTDSLEAGEVAFINWASVNKDEGKLRSGSESRKALKEICEATHRDARQIVLVIDESHHSRETRRAQEVIDEIDPDAILEMSATPTIVVPGHRSEVLVPREQVVEAEVIREAVLVNEGLTDKAKEGLSAEKLDDLLLDLAVAKRQELADLFAGAGVPVNPLLLIQVPDSSAGEEAMAWAERRLSKRHSVTYSNGRLAKWLSGAGNRTYDPDDSQLIGNDGAVQALIFKQAIATGWDCPRAYVLLKLRDPGKSESFEVQTLGRIMRMPERRYYAEDALNQGYVFHPHAEYEPAEDMAVATAAAHWRGELVKPSLAMEWVKRGDTPYLTADEVEAMAVELGNRLDLTTDVKENRRTLTDAGLEFDVDPHALLAEGSFSGEDAADIAAIAEFSVGVSARVVERLFDRLIRRWVGVAANPGLLSDELYDGFDELLDLKTARSVQSFVVRNRDALEAPMVAAVDSVSPRADRKLRLRQAGTWSPVTPRLYNTEVGDETKHEPVDAPHYAYEPCLLRSNRSRPEQAFEDWLEETGDKVEWWMKNGTSPGKDLSLAYPDPAGEDRNFFPDYIVSFADGALALIETKNLEEAFIKGAAVETNKAKLKALKEWVDGAPQGSKRDGAFVVQLASGALRWALDEPPEDAGAARMAELLDRH